MTEPALAPRNAFVGVVAVWAVSFLAAIGIGMLVSEALRIPWMLVAFGCMVLLSFAVQLWYGRTDGFIFRVAGSIIGALLLMGVISMGFAIALVLAVVS